MSRRSEESDVENGGYQEDSDEEEMQVCMFFC